jgi:hypothetical protein
MMLSKLEVHFLLNLPRKGRRMWSCTGQMEAPPPPAQTPALNTTGGALSHQPAEEREEDVELHGLDGGLSPTSSDSGSEHLHRKLALYFLLNLPHYRWQWR